MIGVLVRRESVADRCTHFADHHKFLVGDKLLIPVGFAGMINHSANPNLEKVIDGDRVFLRALRHRTRRGTLLPLPLRRPGAIRAGVITPQPPAFSRACGLAFPAAVQPEVLLRVLADHPSSAAVPRCVIAFTASGRSP